MPNIQVAIKLPDAKGAAAGAVAKNPITATISDQMFLGEWLYGLYTKLSLNPLLKPIQQYTFNGQPLTQADLYRKLADFPLTGGTMELQGLVTAPADTALNLSKKAITDLVSERCEELRNVIKTLTPASLRGLLSTAQGQLALRLYPKFYGYSSLISAVLGTENARPKEGKASSSSEQTLREQCLQILLDANADVNAPFTSISSSKYVLDHAASHGRFDCLNFLLQQTKQEFSQAHLDAALQELSQSSNLTHQNHKQHYFSAVGLLLEKGANIPKSGVRNALLTSAVHDWLQCGKPEDVQPTINILIEKTCKPAEQKEGSDVLSPQELVRADQPIEYENWRCMVSRLVKAGELQTVEKLMAAKVSPNITDEDGYTVLQHAFRSPFPPNLLAMTRLLMTSEGDADHAMSLLAVMNTLPQRESAENVELIQLFLGSNSDLPNEAKAGAETPRLHVDEGNEMDAALGLAIQSGDVQIVKQFLNARGAHGKINNLVLRQSDTQTDLQRASRNAKKPEDFVEILKLMVAFGKPEIHISRFILEYAARVGEAELSYDIIHNWRDTDVLHFEKLSDDCLNNLAKLSHDDKNLLRLLLDKYVVAAGGDYPTTNRFFRLAVQYGLLKTVERYQNQVGRLNIGADHIIAMLDDDSAEAQAMQQWLASHIHEMGIADLISVFMVSSSKVAADSVKRLLVKNEISRRTKSYFGYIGYAGLCLAGVGLAGSAGSGLALPGNNAHMLLIAGVGIALVAGLVTLFASGLQATLHQQPNIKAKSDAKAMQKQDSGKSVARDLSLFALVSAAAWTAQATYYVSTQGDSVAHLFSLNKAQMAGMALTGMLAIVAGFISLCAHWYYGGNKSHSLAAVHTSRPGDQKAAPKQIIPSASSSVAFFGRATAAAGIGAITVEMHMGTDLTTILATAGILVLGFVIDAVLTQLKATQPKAAEQQRTVLQKWQLGLCLGMAGGAAAIAGLGAVAICLPSIIPAAELSYGLLGCAGVIALSLIGSAAQQLFAHTGSPSLRPSAV